MSVLDILQVGQLKRDLKKATDALIEIQTALASSAALSDLQREQRSKALIAEIESQEAMMRDNKASLAAITADIEQRKQEIVQLDDQILLQEFGLYKPKFQFATSDQYKARLDFVREQQSQSIKQGKAAVSDTSWTVNKSQAEGQRMIKDYTKLILRAFNTECDDCVEKVTFFNFDSIKKRLGKSFETLNKLGARMSIKISAEYLASKSEELSLAFEYQQKKQAEKEDQRKQREALREEAKLKREMAEAREALKKDETHFQNALVQLKKQSEAASTDEAKGLYHNEIQGITQKLEEIQTKKQSIDYRENNARAGYVYIISNIGAFGEGVFKIGVTRRLEPTERIDELGDASVPFGFDTHALIFSDDAFALEAAVHGHFSTYRVNKVNQRKEFFRASLDDVESTIRSNFRKPFEFNRLAEASDYRQSLKL